MSASEINNKNLRRICGFNGLTVADLARRINRHRTTLYDAVRNPKTFGPTFRLICEALPIRGLHQK